MFYSAQTNGFYTREIHGANIPKDAVEISDDNYKALLEGQANGKEIVPNENGYPILVDRPDPKTLIPNSVTIRQAKLALLDADLLDKIDEAIEAIPDAKQKAKAKIEWEYAQTVERDSELTKLIAYNLGLSDEQLDDLFLKASEL